MSVERLDQTRPEAATVALVGDARIDEAVAEHDPSGVEPGANLLGHMLGALGEHEEELGQWLRAEAMQPEDRLTQLGALWLPRELDCAAGGAEALAEPRDLRTLTAPVQPLERDQDAGGTRCGRL